MKAIRVHAHGGPEVLRLDEVDPPQPGAGEAVVAVEAAGLNFIDVYFRTGLYKPAGLPFVPGQEGAGTVAAVGPGVTEVAAGDRVAWTSVMGAYAQRAVVPAARLVKLPEGVSARQGAAVMLQGTTAHYLTTSTYPLRAGEACLVHAAAGGVGLLLVQMARARGARVLGTVSTEEKAALAREAGADEVVLYTKDDFEAAARQFTSGRGLSVIYDGVGQATFDKGLRCLAPRGTMVLFGQSSGPVPAFDPLVLSQKGSLFLTRPRLNDYIATREELVSRAGEVLEWVRDGRLRVRVAAEFPLAEAAEAHRALEGRKTTGKVLLLP